MWYGEPEIDIAELFKPQSVRVAMCPPQASTGFATVVVNVRVIRVSLSPVYGSTRVYAEVAVIAPLYRVKFPATGVTPPPVTFGSTGIEKVEGEPQPETPEHGFAVVSVRLNEVK
jgi:hypothetical protein